MKTLTQIIFFAIAIFLFYACNTPRYVYAPTTANTVLFKEKGEAKIEIDFSGHPGRSFDNSRSKSNGFEIKGAYTPVQNFYVHAMTSNRNENNVPRFNDSISNADELYYNRKYQEFGVGYYKSLDPDKTVFFQISAGYGMGKNELRDLGLRTNRPAFYNTEMNKIYFQPGFYLFPTPQFTMAFLGRYESIKFKNVRTNYTAQDQELYSLAMLADQRLNYVAGVINMSYRLKELKNLEINSQFGLTGRFNSDAVYYNHRATTLSIGLAIDPIGLFKK